MLSKEAGRVLGQLWFPRFSSEIEPSLSWKTLLRPSSHLKSPASVPCKRSPSNAIGVSANIVLKKYVEPRYSPLFCLVSIWDWWGLGGAKFHSFH